MTPLVCSHPETPCTPPAGLGWAGLATRSRRPLLAPAPSFALSKELS